MKVRQPVRSTSRFQFGASLLEGLIAIAILSFGVLGLARFQATLITQTTDSQNRAAANSFAEELVSLVRVDFDNAACYALPAKDACASALAKEQAEDWAARVAALGFSPVTANLTGGTALTVSMSWPNKAGDEVHVLEVTTDARP